MKVPFVRQKGPQPTQAQQYIYHGSIFAVILMPFLIALALIESSPTYFLLFVLFVYQIFVMFYLPRNLRGAALIHITITSLIITALILFYLFFSIAFSYYEF